MSLPLSSLAIEEKNKLATSDSVFLIAAAIEIPGVQETIRVVRNTEDITWRGETWQKFPFEMEEITESDTGEVPRVDVRVGNASREMELYIHQYDLYCKENGHAPVVCHLYVINTLNLESDDPEVEHEFELIQPKTDSMWATFTLGASNPFNRRFPQRRMIPACHWKFKDGRCQYDGGATSCNKSFTRCKELNNSERFGGFYATGRAI